MIDEALVAEGVRLILKGIGAKVGDPNFAETPERVARAYAEMLAPKPHTWTTFPAASCDLILLRGHVVSPLCPHHLMTFECKAYVGYLPDERVVGLSKLARVVDAQLDRPILHEDLANAVADEIEENLKPRGVGVILVGTHGCMRFRGVRSQGDVVVSVMRGALLEKSAARAEFLQIAALHKEG